MKNDYDAIKDQQACHYLTFTIVDWIDLFIRPVYKQVIVESLNHFIAQKGLTVYAWCLMSNHLHLLVQVKGGNGLTGMAQDFRKFTAKILLENIDIEPPQRRKWMMKQFEGFGWSLHKNEKFPVWQSSVNPVYIDISDAPALISQIEYIHNNPVRDRIVTAPEDYLYSSARDYAGISGLVRVEMLPVAFKRVSAMNHIDGSYIHKYIRN